MSQKHIKQAAFFWVLQGICTLHRKPFSAELAQQQLASPYTARSLLQAVTAYGFEAKACKGKSDKLHKESFPLIAWLSPRLIDPPAAATSDAISAPANTGKEPEYVVPALILQADASNVLIIESDDSAPATIALSEFDSRFLGYISRVTPKGNPATDPDSEAEARQARKFGFRWFIPELLKHKKKALA
jgi:subfamily B ATP-binding cassette protein HlyB/CyaB